jgi:hypothetical protein
VTFGAQSNEIEREEGKKLRLAILELTVVCKRMTQALAQQMVEGKAMIEVIEENLYKI